MEPNIIKQTRKYFGSRHDYTDDVIAEIYGPNIKYFYFVEDDGTYLGLEFENGTFAVVGCDYNIPGSRRQDYNISKLDMLNILLGEYNSSLKCTDIKVVFPMNKQYTMAPCFVTYRNKQYAFRATTHGFESPLTGEIIETPGFPVRYVIYHPEMKQLYLNSYPTLLKHVETYVDIAK